MSDPRKPAHHRTARVALLHVGPRRRGERGRTAPGGSAASRSWTSRSRGGRGSSGAGISPRCGASTSTDATSTSPTDTRASASSRSHGSKPALALGSRYARLELRLLRRGEHRVPGRRRRAASSSSTSPTGRSPRTLGSLSLGTVDARGSASGKTLFAAAHTKGIAAIDVSNPEKPARSPRGTTRPTTGAASSPTTTFVYARERLRRSLRFQVSR